MRGDALEIAALISKAVKGTLGVASGIEGIMLTLKNALGGK